MNQGTIIIFQVVVLVFSAAVHEYMHGWMADRLGDPTAKLAGRLTLNPIKHLDWFGSLLLPFMMIASNVGFAFGWAKPVPYNPYNLRDKKYGEAKVALAGPMGNFILAFVLATIWRFVESGNSEFAFLLQIAVYINLLLMIFNLVPIPPLDGSKILAAFLPFRLRMQYLSLERFGFFIVLAFVIFGFSYIVPIINYLFRLLVL